MNNRAVQEHFNNLTPGEAERLAILAEECSEVIHVICKIQRHGYGSGNPYLPEEGTNRQMLEVEMGHVRAAMIMLCEAADVRKDRVHAHADEKQLQSKEWLHHQTKG